MKSFSRLACLLAIVALLLTSPLAAQDIDWDQVKLTWHSLTPSERAAYQEMMPAAKAPAGTATILGQKVLPINRAPADMCPGTTNEVGAVPYSSGGDTTALSADYDIAGIGGVCDTTFNSSANDEAWRVQVDVTCDVNALIDGAHDEVIYVVTDCTNLAGTCIASQDNGGTGEDITFTATAGTDYFLIADGWNTAAGAYTLDIIEVTATGCSLVPVELQGFTVD